ncbi:hypothetical protein SprV_0200723600 [Sparganum proliferum]
MTDYLAGADDKSKGVTILSQLDDDVYDLARASGINSTTPVAEIFRDLRGILCGSTPTWLVRSEFRRRVQRPFENVVEFQQALRLLGRKAYPTLAAADLEQTLLEQFIDGVSDPEFRKAPLRQQPSKLDDALRLAQQEEALQAACATPLRGCVGVASMRSQSGVDVSTQTPWRQYACGSCSPRQASWHRSPIRRSTGHQGRRPIQAVDVEQEDNSKCFIFSDAVVSCVSHSICPLVKASVGNVSFSYLVDSGAGRSLVKQQLFTAFQTKVKYRGKPGWRLCTATGAGLEHDGLVEFSLQLSGHMFSHSFLVPPDITWDCILGVDFLNKFRCTLDFDKQLFSTTLVNVPFLTHVPPASDLCSTSVVAANIKDLLPTSLDANSLTQLQHLLTQFKDIFDWDGKSTGRTNVTQHCIDTGDAKPIRIPPRRLPIFYQKELDALISDMLSRKIIRPSHSPWSSPIVLVRKKDGTMRLCVDYRKLNAVTKKDSFPLPRIDATLDTLAGNTVFLTLDLASGYWQVEVRPTDREKTAFAVPSGLYEFETMPFGLTNAPSTFQGLMNQVLSQLIPNSCLVYMVDIIVLGKDFDNHLANLRSVFHSLKQARLTLKPSKCVFIRPHVKFLGHVVSATGVETDVDKVRQIREWPTPSDVTEVRSFLGLVSYYRRFIKDYANIAAPLHRLTQKEKKFKWTAECNGSFQLLKDSLCTSPVLVFPISTKVQANLS